MQNKSFPCPVLRPDNDDYVDGQFQTQIDLSLDKRAKCVDIQYQFDLSQPGIQQLIEQGMASYALKIRSSAAMYCEVAQVAESHGTHQVAWKYLDQKIEVTPFIVAQKFIEQFTSSDFHEVFSGHNYDFACGDPLALGTSQVMPINFEVPEFKTLLNIEVNKSVDPYKYRIDISPENNFITVHAGEEYYRLYLESEGGGVEKVQCAFRMSVYKDCIVRACLALAELGNSEADESQVLWVKSFRQKLSNEGIELPNGEDAGEVFDIANIVAQELVSPYGVEQLSKLVDKE